MPSSRSSCPPAKPTVNARPNLFLVSIGGHRVGLAEGVNWIGRATDCRVQVDCPLASRHHARIMISDLQASLEDGPSKHGTFLRGKRLKEPAALKGGEEVRIGSVRMTFRIVNPDAPTDPK